jgi:hypothetical protein
MSAAFMALGLFISALTSSQITAGTLTFGLWFVMYILGTFGGDMKEHVMVPGQWGINVQRAVDFFYRIFRQIVLELPLDSHAEQMAQGIVQPKDIAYYVLFAAFFLFLTFRALESRKWRA